MRDKAAARGGVWERVEDALDLAAGVVVFGLVLLAAAQILGRKFFNLPLPGFIDWVEQAMAAAAFLGLAYCQRCGAHVRMEIVVSRLRGRAVAVFEIVALTPALVVVAALVWGGFLHFLRAFDWDSPLFSRDSTMDINLPLWPAKLLAPLAFSLLWLRLFLQFWEYARALRRAA